MAASLLVWMVLGIPINAAAQVELCALPDALTELITGLMFVYVRNICYRARRGAGREHTVPGVWQSALGARPWPVHQPERSRAQVKALRSERPCAASALTVAAEFGVGVVVVWQPEWPCPACGPSAAPFVAAWEDLFAGPALRLADAFPGWTPDWDVVGAGEALRGKLAQRVWTAMSWEALAESGGVTGCKPICSRPVTGGHWSPRAAARLAGNLDARGQEACVSSPGTGGAGAKLCAVALRPPQQLCARLLLSRTCLMQRSTRQDAGSSCR